MTHSENTCTDNSEINGIIPLEGENLMYIPLKFEKKLRRRAIIDVGACANAMPAELYEKLKEESPNSISELQQASYLNVKVASGRTRKVLDQVDVQFRVNDPNFQNSFLILPSINIVVIENHFSKNLALKSVPVKIF